MSIKRIKAHKSRINFIRDSSGLMSFQRWSMKEVSFLQVAS
ncbi:unnamed protein product, partial [marine sediment metagenome]